MAGPLSNHELCMRLQYVISVSGHIRADNRVTDRNSGEVSVGSLSAEGFFFALHVDQKIGHGNDGRRSQILIDRLLLFRGIQQAHVADAGVLAGGVARLDERRDSDGGQQTDNRNHDHDFDQGEALFHLLFHFFIS